MMPGNRPFPAQGELIRLIESNPPFNQLPRGIHGSAHARRVLLFSQLICNLIEPEGEEGRLEPDRRLLVVAALLHDSGRENDGPDEDHADRSAELAAAFCRRHNVECNLDQLRDCIRYHCKSGRYHWEQPSLEARILADADKLDRYRFRHQSAPLDPRFLELPCSLLLMPLAADINGHAGGG